MSLFSRIGYCLLQFLILFDELVQVIIRSIIFIVTGDNPPSAHQTISGWVGMGVTKRYKIAIFAQKIIDGIFGNGHCHRVYLFEQSISTPID